jgi:hypothetical protein
MDIVQQFQPFSHSPFPLLPAPAPRPLLSAPKIAGLLPVTTATPFTDTILMRDDPTPIPRVARDHAAMPPQLLKLIAHLPTPDELNEWVDTRRAEIFGKLANSRRERAV